MQLNFRRSIKAICWHKLAVYEYYYQIMQQEMNKTKAIKDKLNFFIKKRVYHFVKTRILLVRTLKLTRESWYFNRWKNRLNQALKCKEIIHAFNLQKAFRILIRLLKLYKLASKYNQKWNIKLHFTLFIRKYSILLLNQTTGKGKLHCDYKIKKMSFIKMVSIWKKRSNYKIKLKTAVSFDNRRLYDLDFTIDCLFLILG
jgi:hypothetical protein